MNPLAIQLYLLGYKTFLTDMYRFFFFLIDFCFGLVLKCAKKIIIFNSNIRTDIVYKYKFVTLVDNNNINNSY